MFPLGILRNKQNAHTYIYYLCKLLNIFSVKKYRNKENFVQNKPERNLVLRCLNHVLSKN